MRLHFVTVPINGSDAAEEELNKFLASRRIVAVDRQLVPDGARSAWAVCVAYVDGAPAPVATSTEASAASGSSGGRRSGIDYREVLPASEFAVFAKLRDLRREIASRDGVPTYAVFTNEQLADIVRRNVGSAEDLARISGVGPARVQKYAAVFLAALRGESSALATPV
jgi:superfamily II DNA helicase RecQ